MKLRKALVIFTATYVAFVGTVKANPPGFPLSGNTENISVVASGGDGTFVGRCTLTNALTGNTVDLIVARTFRQDLEDFRVVYFKLKRADRVVGLFRYELKGTLGNLRSSLTWKWGEEEIGEGIDDTPSRPSRLQMSYMNHEDIPVTLNCFPEH